MSSKITRNIAKKLDLKYKSENRGKFMSQNTNLDRLFLVSMKICCTKDSTSTMHTVHCTLYLNIHFVLTIKRQNLYASLKFKLSS